MIKKYIGIHLSGIIFMVLVVVGAGMLIWRSGEGSTNMTVSETKLSEIKEMVKLCSLEVRDDVAIKDSINGNGFLPKTQSTAISALILKNLTIS